MNFRTSLATFTIAAATFGVSGARAQNVSPDDTIACEAVALYLPNAKAINKYVAGMVEYQRGTLSEPELAAYRKRVTTCAQFQNVMKVNPVRASWPRKVFHLLKLNS
jgi:hypothetical protein